jgi:hypothetical protein
MDKGKIDKMSGMYIEANTLHMYWLNADQQIGQLYELMQAIQKQNQDDADAEEARIVNALDSHKSKTEE